MSHRLHGRYDWNLDPLAVLLFLLHLSGILNTFVCKSIHLIPWLSVVGLCRGFLPSQGKELACEAAD
jgi:hypothetical protein